MLILGLGVYFSVLFFVVDFGFMKGKTFLLVFVCETKNGVGW